MDSTKSVDQGGASAQPRGGDPGCGTHRAMRHQLGDPAVFWASWSSPQSSRRAATQETEQKPWVRPSPGLAGPRAAQRPPQTESQTRRSQQQRPASASRRLEHRWECPQEEAWETGVRVAFRGLALARSASSPHRAGCAGAVKSPWRWGAWAPGPPPTPTGRPQKITLGTGSRVPRDSLRAARETSTQLQAEERPVSNTKAQNQGK